MKTRHYLIAVLAMSLAGTASASFFGKQKIKVYKAKPKKNTEVATPAPPAEPDKILYDRAVNSIKHGRYTEGRLEYQTLINTYPDSEFLAKAKLGIADSYYKEGGVANLTQAIDAYKSFIVFFPFLNEASYAQMQVAMCHFRMMDKADRDPTQAQDAEQEFQTFLLKYPQSPLVPQAEQQLREVQEVLAQGEFEIGRFYYLKPDYAAAAARFIEVAERYPLFSESDQALWLLGDIYTRAKEVSRNEDEKNHWADLSAKCYRRIVRDYPLSSHAADARARLRAMGMSVPAADPHALARMRKDQQYEKKHHEFVLLRLPLEMLESKPDVSAAARTGQPNLSPPSDTVSATDVFKRNAKGPVFNTIVASANAPASSSPSADSNPVEGSMTDSSGSTPTTAVGAEIIDPPDASATSAAPTSAPASDNSGASQAQSAVGPSTLSSVSSGSSQTSSTVANSASSSPASNAAPSAAAPSAQSPTPQAATAPQASQAQSKDRVTAPKVDHQTESTSKKKKGLHKIFRF